MVRLLVSLYSYQSGPLHDSADLMLAFTPEEPGILLYPDSVQLLVDGCSSLSAVNSLLR